MTKKYVGRQVITAWPEQALSKQEGYAVKDPEGYTRWTDQETFAGRYVELPPTGHLAAHQERVVAEKALLDYDMTKLAAFFNTTTFGTLGDAECDRLQRQHGLMVQLSAVLAERIAAFPPIPTE